MTRCQSSSDVSVMAVCGRMAALLTSTSIAPSSASPSFTMASTAAASAMSPRTGTARTPALRHSAATASSSSRLTRVFSTRSAPSAAKASAMARPILRLAPVTNAVLPSSFIRLLVDNHGALDLSLLHQVEGVVQLLRRKAARHHLLEPILARHEEVDEQRHVGPLVARSERRAREHALLEKQPGIDGQPRAGGADAYDDAGAAAMRRGEGLLDGLLRANHLEGEVDTADATQRLYTRDRILLRGVHDVGRPELLRPLQLLRVDVDGDDLARAYHARRLDGIEPNAAAAEHGHAGTRRHLGPIEHGTGAREHAAAHEARQIEGRVLADRNDALLEQDGV